MSQSLSRFQALLLGAVVLLAVGLAAFGLFLLADGQWPWSKPFLIQVGFPNAQGVTPGTRVRIQGVEAGEVREVRQPATPGDKVMLTLRLDSRFRDLVRTDARARIEGDGMFGGKIIEIDPGSAAAGAVAQNAEIAPADTSDLNSAIAQLGPVLKSLGPAVESLGSIAQAMDKEKSKVGEIMDNTNQMVKKTTETVESVQQVVDGVKEMWYIRDKVKDPQKLLFPPGCECNPYWFAEDKLFDPGSDRLTAQGRKELDELVGKIGKLTRHNGSEVVVVAYADPKSADGSRVRRLTQNQGEVVLEYLKGHSAIHKDYGVWEHKATAVGLGIERPPVPERDKLAPGGVGVLVFVPQGKK